MYLFIASKQVKTDTWFERNMHKLHNLSWKAEQNLCLKVQHWNGQAYVTLKFDTTIPKVQCHVKIVQRKQKTSPEFYGSVLLPHSQL